MSLKSAFSALKRSESYVLKPLEGYLLSLNEDQNRAINVNSPSSSGGCLRARYYSRTYTEHSDPINPRTRRIFDNGSYVHKRLQDYLTLQGMLLMAEVPVLNVNYNIQGHTDGIVDIGNGEIAILEIKSINSRGFDLLKSAKEEHKLQGLLYLYCIETRRKEILEVGMGNPEVMKKLLKQRYSHLNSGKVYTKKEKIQFQLDLHKELDEILTNINKPVTKIIFLYENKDNQEIKEFVVYSTDPKNAELLQNELKRCTQLNEFVNKESIPAREGKSKSDYSCRYCSFASECWIV